MVNGDDKGEEADEEKEGTRKPRWADCEEEKKRDKEQQRESGIRQERSRALRGWMAVMRNRKGMRDQPEVRGVRCVDEWRCGARRARSKKDEENKESKEDEKNKKE